MDYDIVIIGGGVAGLTAAMYASRGGAKTLLIEENYVGGITITLDNVENFPGIPNLNGFDFINSLYGQVLNSGASVQIAKITKIEFETKKIFSTIGEINYKALIIATGSTYKKLGVVGEDRLLQKGVSYCAICDGALYKNKKVVVVTNGTIGISSINYLSNITPNITVLDLSNSYKDNNYNVYNNVIISKIYGDKFVEGIELNSNNKIINIDCEGIFIAIGREYNIDILNNEIDTNNGFIVTNNNLETNLKGVYAIGDIRNNSTKQIVCACSDGATSALNALKLIKK